MTIDPILKRCPFCGSDARIEKTVDPWVHIGCSRRDCVAYMALPCQTNAEHAVQRWNQRSGDVVKLAKSVANLAAKNAALLLENDRLRDALRSDDA